MDTCHTTVGWHNMTPAIRAPTGWDIWAEKNTAIEDMPWAKPEYSRQRVNTAGKMLVTSLSEVAM